MMQVDVAERRDQPGVWSVEAIDDDGAIYQALFAGPTAEARAFEYARVNYSRRTSCRCLLGLCPPAECLTPDRCLDLGWLDRFFRVSRIGRLFR